MGFTVGPYTDIDILNWICVQLFAKTQFIDDESNQQIIRSISSSHPYAVDDENGLETMYYVHYPFVESLYFMFDPKCKTFAGDTLAFYEDKECTKLVKATTHGKLSIIPRFS
jgi:hypothetical protein